MFNPYNETEIKDVAPTLTAQGDSITKSGTVLKVEEIKLPGAYGRNFGSKGKIQDEICDTLQAAMGCGGGNVPLVKEFSSGEFRNLDEYIEYLKEIQDQIPVKHQNLELENGTKVRIRKLTPKECWRLMGFDDEDFEKAEKVNSNTQLYKQARKFYCGKCA